MRRTAPVRPVETQDFASLQSDTPVPEYNPSVWQRLVEWLHKQKGYDPKRLTDPEPRAAIEETRRILAKPLNDLAITQDIPEELTATLDQNIFFFSGFKTHHELVEASRMLKGDDGNFKPFQQFLKDVETINKVYNRNYLQAEYNFATASTQMAVKWKEWEQDGDRYDLQYRTAGDSRVREEHAALDGITLPPSDPFWDSYLPPNGWNCRCTAVQVRQGKYPRSDSAAAMAAGANCTDTPKKQIFRFNPGKQEKIFPPKHPYFKASTSAQQAVQQVVRQNANAVNSYKLNSKTVSDAEKEIAQNLGVTCNFKGFTKNDMGLIQDIYSSVATHFDKYPDLKKHIKFVGSMQGRKALFYDKFYQELKARFPSFPDSAIQSAARKQANQYASISSNTYAYSAPSTKFDLNGIAFNASWRGDKVKKQLDSDVNAKWHPNGCNTVKSVFDHELGHKIDETIGLKNDSEFLKIFSDAEKQGKDYIKDNLSRYAYKQSYASKSYDPKEEFIAEAWSEYLNNPKPRDIAKAVGELIVKKTNWKK